MAALPTDPHVTPPPLFEAAADAVRARVAEASRHELIARWIEELEAGEFVKGQPARGPWVPVKEQIEEHLAGCLEDAAALVGRHGSEHVRALVTDWEGDLRRDLAELESAHRFHEDVGRRLRPLLTKYEALGKESGVSPEEAREAIEWFGRSTRGRILMGRTSRRRVEELDESLVRFVRLSLLVEAYEAVLQPVEPTSDQEALGEPEGEPPGADVAAAAVAQRRVNPDWIPWFECLAEGLRVRIRGDQKPFASI